MVAKQKMKTKKSLAKRFRVTKTGKVLRGRTGVSHLKRKKTKSALGRKKKPGKAKGAWARKVKKMLGY